MSDTRLDQARAEAERRWPRNQSPDDPYPEGRRRRMSMDRRIGFELGVVWADANPYSTPEDLVTAYEGGQRDAVSKGLARSWIARTQLHHVAWTLQNLPEDKIAAMLPGLLGIEVRDE